MSNFNVNAYLKSGLLNASNNKPNNNNYSMNTPQHKKNYLEIRKLRNEFLPFATEYKEKGLKTPNLKTRANKYVPMMGQLRQKVNTYRRNYAPTGVWQQGVRKQRKTRKNRNGKSKI
jgi:hypothetical protein